MGGVLIAHKIHEGKHQYVVENVVKYKMENEGKLYVRYNLLSVLRILSLQLFSGYYYGIIHS